jgi:hypothetical protein
MISDVASLIKALGGNPDTGMCRCPAHDDETPSLHVCVGNSGIILVHCFARCPQEKIIAKLKEKNLWNGGTGRPLTPDEREEAKQAWRNDFYERFRTGFAVMRAAIMREAKEPSDNLKPYLKGRGIDSVPPAAAILSANDAIRLGLPFKFPAMVLPILGAASGDYDGTIPDSAIRVMGAHVTFLTKSADRNLKEPVGKTRKNARRIYGSFRNGFIPLSLIDDYRSNTPLVIAEGVETTLAAMKISGLPGIAMISASNDLTVLPDCSTAIICPDNDNDRTGYDAALRLAGSLDAKGRQWKISLPELLPGRDKTDWNDVLLDALEKNRDLDELRKQITDGTCHASASNRERPKEFTAAELQSMQFSGLKWVVRGLITEGLTLFIGKPKLGKSWMCLDIAQAVATGQRTLGEVECEQGDVLYLALEDSPRRLKRRLEKLLGNGDWPSRLDIWTECPYADEGGVDRIRAWLASHPKGRLVIIDVFKRFRSRKGNNDQLYDRDYQAGQALQALATEFGAAILVVHHARKADADDPLDSASSTTGLTGVIDAGLVLFRDGQGTILYVRGRDVEEQSLAVSFDRATCQWTAQGDAAEVRVSQERKAILKVLKEAGEPMTPNKIAQALNKKVGIVDQLLFKMIRDQQIRKIQRGSYVCADFGGKP